MERLDADRTAPRRLAILVSAGIGLAAAGLAWNASFPINKSFWTSSYVLFTSGLAFVALAGCWFAIDVRGRRRWAMPFVAFGRNAILVFFLSGIMARLLGLIHVPRGDETVSLQSAIWRGVFQPSGPPELASLLFALAFLVAWIGIAWLLYRRRIFFKV